MNTAGNKQEGLYESLIELSNRYWIRAASAMLCYEAYKEACDLKRYEEFHARFEQARDAAENIARVWMH